MAKRSPIDDIIKMMDESALLPDGHFETAELADEGDPRSWVVLRNRAGGETARMSPQTFRVLRGEGSGR